LDLIYQGFEKYITIAGPLGVAAKVAADQTLIAPWSLLAFFYCQSKLEGRSEDSSRSRATTMLIPTYKACLPFWCVVHTITFGLIPSQHRIAWASLASVGWNAFLSNANQTAKQVGSH
jgi:hypothetical protein